MIDVELVFFPLHPDTPTSGRSLETMFARSQVFTDYV